jgi:DME family drug/metabolite transporter
MTKNQLHGALAILGASMLWGIGYFLQKLAVIHYHPFVFAFYTITLGWIFLFIYHRFAINKLWQLFLADRVRYLALSFFGGALAPAMMFLGLTYLDVGVASILERTQPLFVIFLAWLMLGEKLAANKYLYVVLTLISSYFVVTQAPQTFSLSTNDTLGILAMAAAAFLWGLATIIGKELSGTQASSAQIAVIRFFIASFCLLPLALWFGLNDFTKIAETNILLITAGNALLAVAVAYTFFYDGMKYLNANKAVFLEALSPLTAIACGMIFLSETLVWTQIIAIPLLLFSVYKITVK